MQLINTVDPTIHLAIELSASSWLIAARVPGSEKPHLHRIDGGNTAALLALISSLRARVARRLDAARALFGCHRNYPLMHLGSAGLLWAINGGKLVELHRDWAVIELPVNRSQRIYYRREVAAGKVTLPWERA
jgi:hypothetical protein